jgi:hypothetical protein
MQNVRQTLSEIESKYNIKILYACETGSRAWGFHHQTATMIFALFIVIKEIGTCH